MTPTLTLSGDFIHPDLDSLCHELRDLSTWPPDQPGRVDLRGLNDLDPTTLAVLLASLRGLHSRGVCDPVENLVPPEGDRALSCLGAAALRALIWDEVGHWQKEEGDEPATLGCEAFAGSKGIDRVTSSLQVRLAGETEWSAASLRAFGSMAFELAENVMQHSHTQGGVAVLKIRPVEQRVSLAIADNGIGVRKSLARNPDYRDIGDDLTAIVASMGAGATAEPGTGGGMGLYFARLLVRANGGSLLIRSGDASREESGATSDSRRLPHLQGTLIAVEARTDRPLDYGPIEASLEQPDGLPG